MVSLGPDCQSYNFSHMYSFVDLRSNTLEPVITRGSIYDFINSHPRFSKFKQIISRAKQIGFLNDSQANCTMLIPTDDFLKNIPQGFFDTMDDGLARQIISASTIDRKIDKKLLTSSPVAYYITRLPQMRMYVTNISGKTRVNNCVNVVQFDLNFNNGMIHIIDGLIVPNLDHFMN